MEDELLSLSAAARVIGITRSAVDQALKAGHMSYSRHGPWRLILRSECLRYKDHSEHDPDMQKRNPKYRVYARDKSLYKKATHGLASHIEPIPPAPQK